MPTKTKSKLINPKGESLTVEKFRELTGLQLSDEQAEEAVESIKKFARSLFETAIQQKRLTENKENSDL